jgi:hypothetical protein
MAERENGSPTLWAIINEKYKISITEFDIKNDDLKTILKTLHAQNFYI